MRTVFLCVLAGLCVSTTGAQEFEAVSVKANRSGLSGSSSHSDNSQLSATNISLKQLIARAFLARGYQIRDNQIEGPDWLETERFDVIGKFPAGMPKDPQQNQAVFQAIMQKMLVDYFGLVAHKTEKMLPAYGLVVIKSGIKFRKSESETQSDSSNGRNGVFNYTGRRVDMKTFAAALSPHMDLPVVDATGLPGIYDIKMDWTELRASADAQIPNGVVYDPTEPLRAALSDQLGLKLDSRKAPIEVVIVDHIERTPRREN